MRPEVVPALRRMLPPGVAFAVFDDALDEAGLFPEETALVARAVERRRQEFARGRVCARKALAQLGVAPQVIGVGEGRQPLWPEGFVGSITHCEGLTCAVAAPTDQVAAIGLDAEVAVPLPEEVRGHVLHPSEVEAARSDSVLETLIFSAKESVHKTVYPRTGVWMDFLDVEVELDLVSVAFRVDPAAEARAIAPELRSLEGRFELAGGFVLTLAWQTA